MIYMQTYSEILNMKYAAHHGVKNHNHVAMSSFTLRRNIWSDTH